MSIIKRKVIRLDTARVIIEPNWRSRTYPFWFNRRYPDGMRRISVPLLTIDLNLPPRRPTKATTA